MGAIGQIVAEIATLGLGMKVVYHSRSHKPDIESRLGVEYLPLEKLLQTVDVLSLHCALTPETTDLLGRRELGLMKSSAIIVNTARPKIINPQSLHKALMDNTIAGCAMDGYYIEPAPSPQDDPYGLLSIKDDVFLVTSHLAYLTEDSIRRMCELAVNSILRLFDGQPWDFVVNPQYKEYLS